MLFGGAIICPELLAVTPLALMLGGVSGSNFKQAGTYYIELMSNKQKLWKVHIHQRNGGLQIGMPRFAGHWSRVLAMQSIEGTSMFLETVKT